MSILSPTSVSFSTITGISEPAAFAQLLTESVFAPHLPAVAVHRVRTRPGRRLEAPRALWNVYEVEIDLPDGQRTSRLVWTKAFFNGEDCQEYHSRIQGLLDRLAFNPLDADGYATFIPTYNLFVFFFPVDPVFPMLSTAFDGRRIKPILEPHFRHLLGIDRADSIDIERVKYLPEISAIARYRAAGAGSGPAIYGKVQHSRKGAFTYEVMQALWALPARSSGELVIAEPLGYYPEYDLLLQSEVPGDDITGDRHSEVFMAQAEAAGRVIGRIHQSGITVGRPHTIDVEIERLKTRLEEFKLSSPSLYLLIRGLLNQIVARARRIAPESPVPSHGDYKYNQFLYDGERFGLIDVEYFVQAEPSFDLGKYCGHLVPSSPGDWSDTAQANVARRTFLDAYQSICPDYEGRRFPLYEALSLATRALVVTWSQARNWEHTAETLVALGFERLKTRWRE